MPAEMAHATRARRLLRVGIRAGIAGDTGRRPQLVQRPAAVEGLDRRGGQAPHPERLRLQRGAGLRLPLKHQHRAARESELAGE